MPKASSEPPTSPTPQRTQSELREMMNVLMPDRPATGFDDMTDYDFDAVLDQIYAPSDLRDCGLRIADDWPARDALGDDCC